MIPRVYLDNVITSGWVLKDLKPQEEMEAVERLYALHDAGIIKRVTSKISGIEQARTTDLQKRAALAASADLFSAVQNDHRLLGFANLDYGARGFISYPLIDDIVDPALFEQLTKDIRPQRRRRQARHVCRNERLQLLRDPRHERSASQVFSN